MSLHVWSVFAVQISPLTITGVKICFELAGIVSFIKSIHFFGEKNHQIFSFTQNLRVEKGIIPSHCFQWKKNNEKFVGSPKWYLK